MENLKPEEAARKAHAVDHKLLMIGQPITGNWLHKKVYGSCMNVISPVVMFDLLMDYQVMTVARIINDFPIDYNRNKFVDEALAAGADYLMFMDMDMTFPARTIPMLFENLTDETPVVAGMYFLKKEPFSPVIGRYIDWTDNLLKAKDNLKKQDLWMDDGTEHGKQLIMYRSITYYDKEKGPFQADVIGMGCVLVKADVFKKLKRPYFRYSYDPEKGDPAWQKLSEDMYWCAQLKQAGIPIMIDPRVQCGHLMELESNTELYENHREMLIEHLRREKPEQLEKMMKEIIDVRSEQKEIENGDGAEKVVSSREASQG